MYSSLAFLVATCNSQHKAHKNQRINQQTAKSSHLINPFGWCKNVASSDGHWCSVTAPESSHFNKLHRSCYCVSYSQFLKLHAAETKFSNQLTYWPKDPQKKVILSLVIIFLCAYLQQRWMQSNENYVLLLSIECHSCLQRMGRAEWMIAVLCDQQYEPL
jgi:hypothetical protein